MAATKADIVDSVSKRIAMTKNRSFEVVETMLELMKKALEDGEDVLVSGIILTDWWVQEFPILSFIKHRQRCGHRDG